MKAKIIGTCMLLALLTGCGNEVQTAPQDTKTQTVMQAVDVDLSVLSSTMVYSEVFNMMSDPEAYVGKTVRMTGSFNLYQDEATGKNYYACLIADATACCAQGIEFVLANNAVYPDDYPAVDSEITVRGKMQTYEENGLTYCELVDAVLE